MFDQLMEALNMVLQWQNFFWALFGVTFGIIMGAIPGLSDNMAIVLLLPFTYYLGPIPGIAMLMGLSKGANFGGSIPAILFNIPGTPQAMITTFDGYPLAKSGKSGKALKTALFASVTADTASDLVLILLYIVRHGFGQKKTGLSRQPHTQGHFYEIASHGNGFPHHRRWQRRLYRCHACPAAESRSQRHHL